MPGPPTSEPTFPTWCVMTTPLTRLLPRAVLQAEAPTPVELVVLFLGVLAGVLTVLR